VLDARDNYSLLEKIFSGSVASTYRGLQRKLDRQVLVKILHPHLATDAQLVSRFEREARACASLRHENIISIFDYGRWDDSYFLVTEWVEGVSLSMVLKKAGRLPLPVALEITRQTCNGLCYAHSRGVIHRDVKPANIMVSMEGDVKISDFGLAWAKGMPSITLEGTIVGTPAYMSPEQAQASPLDKRTDIFSLGLTTYEMITGLVVYGAPTYSGTITRILSEDVKPIREVDPTIPAQVQSILSRMLQRDRRRRYGDCSETIDDIERWAAGSRVSLSKPEVAGFVVRPSVLDIKPVKPTFKQRISFRTFGLAALAAALLAALFVIRERKPPRNDYPIPAGIKIEKQTAKAKDPLSDRGSVFIDSRPGRASVKLDGAWAGMTTPCLIGGLQPGSHRVVLHKPGFDSAAASLEIEAGGRASLSLDLIKKKRAFGLVRFRISPWAKVYVDGKHLDTTPIGEEVRIEEGVHVVTLENPDYPVCTDTLNVFADTVVDFSVNLDEKIGYLRIGVDPWADLYIDGAKVGTTPVSEPIALTTGAHQLSLRNPAFLPHVETLHIEPRKTVEKLVKLKAGG